MILDIVGSAIISLRPVSGQPEPSALGRELRIYLADVADVQVGPPLVATTLDGRIAEATKGLGNAKLVAWLEQYPTTSGGTYVVVIVGRRDGRAVVDVGSVAESDASARLLALRVGAFLDETLTSGTASTALAAGPIPTPPRWFGAELDLGVSGSFPLGRLAIAHERRVGPVHLRALAGIAGSLATHHDTLELDEARLGVAALAVVPLGDFDVAAGLGIDGVRIHARAASAMGEVAELTRYGAIGRAMLGGGWWFASQIAIRLELGTERAFVVERFLVAGQARAEIGRLAFAGSLGFLARF